MTIEQRRQAVLQTAADLSERMDAIVELTAEIAASTRRTAESFEVIVERAERSR
jgi:hypothetical protein